MYANNKRKIPIPVAYMAILSLLVTLTSLIVIAIDANEFSKEPCGVAYGVALYKESGFPIRVEAYMKPGNGTFILKGVTHDSIFKLSNKLAAYQAALDQGVSPWSIDILIIIKPFNNTPPLSGPSLSLTTYVAVSQCLGVAKYTENTAFTGLVNPDSTIGFVSGVPKKLEVLAEWGYVKAYYPRAQEYEYKIEEQHVHVGPYKYTRQVIVKTPALLPSQGIEARGVVSAQELAEVAREASFEDVLNGNALLPYELGRLSNKLAQDARHTIIEVKKQRASLMTSTAVAQGTLTTVDEHLTHADKALSLYSLFYQSHPGSIIAIDLACRAYGEAVSLKKLLDLTLDPSYVTIEKLRTWIEKELELTKKMLENAIPPESPSQLLLLMEASRLYLDAEQTVSNVLMGLLAIMSGFAEPGQIVLNIADDLGTAVYKLKKSQFLSLAAASLQNDTLATTIDLERLWSRMLNYTRETLTLSEELSQLSHVASDLLIKARAHINKAIALWAHGDYIERLAALEELVQSLTLTQTYLSLHPGIEEVWETRLPYIYGSLLVLEKQWGPRPLLVQMILENGLLNPSPSSRLYWVEQAIAYYKLNAAIHDLTKQQQVERRGEAVPPDFTYLPPQSTRENLLKIVIIVASALSLLTYFALLRKMGS